MPTQPIPHASWIRACCYLLGVLGLAAVGILNSPTYKLAGSFIAISSAIPPLTLGKTADRIIACLLIIATILLSYFFIVIRL